MALMTDPGIQQVDPKVKELTQRRTRGWTGRGVLEKRSVKLMGRKEVKRRSPSPAVWFFLSESSSLRASVEEVAEPMDYECSGPCFS